LGMESLQQPQPSSCGERLWAYATARVPVLTAVAQWFGDTADEFEGQGYTSGFKTFNHELFRPWKGAEGRGCSTCAETLTLRPRFPKMAFIVWNVVCFWIGIFDAVLVLTLESKFSALGFAVAAFDSLLGYAFAYTFYFLFITTGPRTKLWMFRGLILIALYVLGTGALVYLATRKIEFIEHLTGETVNEVVLEIVIEGAKCFANTIVFYHGLRLYIAQPNDGTSLASRRSMGMAAGMV